MTLLCTLGASWAVIPEAFLLGNGASQYQRVVVLTSESTQSSVNQCTEWFRDYYPEVCLKILAVKGLEDLACAEDHARFEEAIYRAYGNILNRGTELHVCLAGGFKTMSAAAHQAADILGCAKLFHVTAKQGEHFSENESIVRGIDEGKIRLVDLGARPGWPTMRELVADSPPIPSGSGTFPIENTLLRESIYERLQSASSLMGSVAEIAGLPFPQIARWSPSERDWLEQPLNPETDIDWLRALPKIELHCHLGGFATHGSLLEQVEAAADNPDNLISRNAPELPNDWPIPEHSCDLLEYMHLGDNGGSRLLRDPGCLQKHIELLYAELSSQNIAYAEIRCSPANYADKKQGRSPWQVLSEIKSHFDNCRRNDQGHHPVQVNLIIIATRKEGGDYRSDISRHLALAVTAAEHWRDAGETRIVGVDLAGYENKETRGHYFREEFTAVHRCGLALTIHAGENDDAESIWSAVFDLNTRRIGHALHLIDSPDLLRSVADRKIGVEMCPYANYQIKGFAPMPGQQKDYPLLDYLNAGVRVSINTDNIGISAADLTDNLAFLATLCPGITRRQLLQLQANALETSFLHHDSRTVLRVQVEKALNQLRNGSPPPQ